MRTAVGGSPIAAAGHDGSRVSLMRCGTSPAKIGRAPVVARTARRFLGQDPVWKTGRLSTRFRSAHPRLVSRFDLRTLEVQPFAEPSRSALPVRNAAISCRRRVGLHDERCDAKVGCGSQRDLDRAPARSRELVQGAGLYGSRAPRRRSDRGALHRERASVPPPVVGSWRAPVASFAARPGRRWCTRRPPLKRAASRHHAASAWGWARKRTISAAASGSCRIGVGPAGVAAGPRASGRRARRPAAQEAPTADRSRARRRRSAATLRATPDPCRRMPTKARAGSSP